MRWKFKKIFENDRFAQYAYSRESDALDGVVQYDKEKNEITVLKLCANDEGSKFCERKAKEHFSQVITGGMEDEAYICCG